MKNIFMKSAAMGAAFMVWGSQADATVIQPDDAVETYGNVEVIRPKNDPLVQEFGYNKFQADCLNPSEEQGTALSIKLFASDKQEDLRVAEDIKATQKAQPNIYTGIINDSAVMGFIVGAEANIIPLPTYELYINEHFNRANGLIEQTGSKDIPKIIKQLQEYTGPLCEAF